MAPAEIQRLAFEDFARWQDAHSGDECQDEECQAERYARDCETGAWVVGESR